MYEVSVQAEFAAAHAIRIGTDLEPLHGHNWRVTACLEGRELGADGLLVDFHKVERALRDIAAPLHNRNLNDCPPFSRGVNPTAERVARHFADELARRLGDGGAARLSWVRVTEAPGCAATYRPARERSGA